MSVRLEGRLAHPDRAASGDFCPIERTMKLLGSRSAMLLMREAAYGTTRFDDFARRSGLTDAVAASRLRELVAEGLLAKRPYQDPGQRVRHEYVLTESGRDLLPVLMALADWGKKHLPRRGTPSFTHADCGEAVTLEARCSAGHVVREDEFVVSA